MNKTVTRQLSVLALIAIILLNDINQIAFAQTVAESINQQNNQSSEIEQSESQTDGLNNTNSVQNGESQNDAGSPIDVNEGELVTAPTDNPMILFGKFIMSLILVIVLIYAVVRFLAVRQRKLQNHSVFQSLGGLTLGTNKSIQLVKMGQGLYILGVADQITLIKELDNPEEIDQIMQQISEQEEFLTNRLLSFWPWSKEKKEDHLSSTFSFQDMFQQSIEQQINKQQEVVQQLQSRNSEQREGRF